MNHANEGNALGLIAGAGQLPIEAARLLRRSGYTVAAIGFEGLTDSSLAREVDCAHWSHLGQLEVMAKALVEMDARRLILIGKVPKSLVFATNSIARPDAEAMRVLAREPDRSDEPLMTAIAGWLEARGFVVCDQGEMLSSMLAQVEALSARAPATAELADFEVGRAIVQSLGRLGVGQCVIVKQGSVLAVEAAEGTDAAIQRAGELGGAGATVIKAARPGQDRRFDLPAVGAKTIDALVAAGASALAIEAGSTLIVDREAMAESANRANIAVWGFPTDENPA